MAFAQDGQSGVEPSGSHPGFARKAVALQQATFGVDHDDDALESQRDLAADYARLDRYSEAWGKPDKKAAWQETLAKARAANAKSDSSE